jgi:hypothetical protein
MTSQSLDDFVKQLDAISESDGILYGRARLLSDAEQKHQRAILQYTVYLALSDAFKCFFLETVELINPACRPKVTEPLSELHEIFVTRLIHSFKSLCGADRIAICGYPYQAYTLLQDVFNDLVLSSAALQKITDFYSVDGVIPGKPIDIAQVKELRKHTELAVCQKMTGKESDLTQQTQDELSNWDALFHSEVHGVHLSLAAALGFMKGTELQPALPRFDAVQFAMFVNRYFEVCWMAHRLIPALQPSGVPLSQTWMDKWGVLDAALEMTVQALTVQHGNKIGAAIVELVKTKFPFNAQSDFPL